MHVIETKIKETIRVIHNNLDAMHENIETLKRNGYSGNTRYSMVGIPLVTEEMGDVLNVGEFIARHPEVEVQYPKENDYFHTRPYIYVTEHEREVNE
ncbi:hypothetical protein [Lysinibacillus sp. FSL K6-3209]|uniref:hypothetical protein n=1 Tax=Lysinibacillus sp. FSL K6-3209 TaxID=2921497 RepID=UPI0030DB901E